MGGLPTDHPNHFILQMTMQRAQGNLKGWPPSFPSGGLPIPASSEQSAPDSSAQRGQQIVAAIACFTTSLILLILSLYLRLIARHYTVKSFITKFHCELNLIEQCWGAAKWIYCMYPVSSKEADLEANVISALDSVPIAYM